MLLNSPNAYKCYSEPHKNKMAIFTPYKDPISTPDYKPPKEVDVGSPDKSAAVAVQGLTNVFNASVNAVDTINKTNIDKQLREGIDAERDASINAGLDLMYPNQTVAVSPTPETSQPQGPTPVEVPPGVQQGVRQMQQYAQANRMGKMEDVPYYGNMQSIAQRVISQYPGYAEYIHQKTAQILGTNPANAQRSAIQTSLQQLYGARDSAAEKNAKFLEQNAEHFVGADGKFDRVQYLNAVAAINSGDPARVEGVKMYVAEKKANKEGDEQATRRLAQVNAVRTVDSATAEQEAHGFATRALNNTLTTAKFSLSGETMTWEGLVKKVGELNANGGKADPELLSKLGVVARQFKASLETNIRLDFMRPRQEWGGKSLYQMIGSKEKADAIMKQYVELMNPIIDDIGSNNLNMATRTMNTLQGQRDNFALQGLKIPIFQDWARMGGIPQQAAGAVVQHQMTQGTPGRPAVGVQQEVVDALRDMRMREITASANKGSLNTILERWNTAVPTRPGPRSQQEIQDRADYIRRSVDDVKAFLTNPLATPQQRLAAAVVISDPASTEFLMKLDPNQRMTMFRNIATKQVTDMVAELGKSDPDVWDNYQTWVKQTFKRLYNTQAGTITSEIQKSGAKVEFDTETGKIIPPEPRGQSISRARGADTLPLSNTGYQAINEINKGLDAYKYVLELNGEKLDQSQLEALGIKIQPPAKERTSGAPKGSERPSTSRVPMQFTEETPRVRDSSVIRDAFGQINDQPIPYEFGSQEQQRLLDTGRQRQRDFPMPR
jgi:hypothetical protein